MKGENQKKRRRELWRLKGKIKREREKVKKKRVLFFVVFIPTGVGLHRT